MSEEGETDSPSPWKPSSMRSEGEMAERAVNSGGEKLRHRARDEEMRILAVAALLLPSCSRPFNPDDGGGDDEASADGVPDGRQRRSTKRQSRDLDGAPAH